MTTQSSIKHLRKLYIESSTLSLERTTHGCQQGLSRVRIEMLLDVQNLLESLRRKVWHIRVPLYKGDYLLVLLVSLLTARIKRMEASKKFSGPSWIHKEAELLARRYGIKIVPINNGKIRFKVGSKEYICEEIEDLDTPAPKCINEGKVEVIEIG